MAGRCLGHRQPPRPGAAHATLGGLLHQQPDFCIKRGGFASKPSRSCCLQSQRRKLPFSVFLDPPARIPYMQVKELHIQRFRGFDDLSVKPKGHVVVMGEPGAGRSDLIEALARVLDAYASRNRITTELDFYNRDTSQPIQIALTLGDLGADIEQDFLDHMELWDGSEERLLPETEGIEEVDQDQYEWVLRLEYRAKWLLEEERCEEWVFYPKESDPTLDSFLHVRRLDIENLGFNLLRWGGGRILDLSSRSAFRRVIEKAGGNDFAAAIAQYVQNVGQAAGQFTGSAQVKAALEDVVAPVSSLLRIPVTDVSEILQFAPEGGSPSGLLRSLGPSMDLGDDAGSLPAWRRGSTTESLLRIAEALALSSDSGVVLAVDDLGDGLDAASSAHLTAVIRKSGGQAWVTTRVPAVAEVFASQEVVRLGRDMDGGRFIRQGRRPTTKAENVAAKHWHRNLLPALSYHSVIVVEGPNDFAALHNLALRLSEEQGLALPATRGVSIVNAGSGGSGGYAGVLKLAGEARDIGLHAVGVVDGDTRKEAQQHLQTYGTLPDAIVRLPDGVAIEAAIVDGVPDAILRQALRDVQVAAGLDEPHNFDEVTGARLADAAIRFIKNNSMHGPLIDSLPPSNLPPLAVQLLNTAIEAAAETHAGLIQL